jgi:putative cardiolipin synthase
MITLCLARRIQWLAANLCCMWVLSACGGLPQQVERKPSTTMLETAQTQLGKALAPALVANPGKSGFHPVGDGADAFVARVALARAAQKTLDVQYYIYHVDNTGVALLGEILAAADRGVRVRLLLDDIHVAGRDDALAVLDSHPNIEVKLFNPFAHRDARWIDLLTDYSRVNRRMHNKSMTADSQIAIVGGRNIGDEYFAAGPDVEFGDFDVLAAGPVVAQISAEFDAYWNSDVSYRVSTLIPRSESEQEKLGAMKEKIAAHTMTVLGTPYFRGLRDTDLAKSISEKKLQSYWGEATVIADRPEKVKLPTEDPSTHAIPKLGKILGEAKEELVLVSPYFVPGEQGVAWLRDVARRGVRVKILTNSFAATDVSAVHAGYSGYRKSLLEAGIELYELKPSADAELDREGKHHSLSGSSKSSLHAKTYMVDRRTLFVGSLNLDPRSAFLNTEMGVVIESEPLCAALREKLIDRLPDIAYRVELDKGADPGGHLVWITREGGNEVRYNAEPGMGFFQKIMQGVLRLLPIEDQL